MLPRLEKWLTAPSDAYKNTPMSKHTGTTSILRALKVGKAVELKIGRRAAKNLFVFAKRLEISIATRREGDVVRVWRLR